MRIRQNHSGFETQRRRHQKSKNRGASGPKIGHVNVSDKKAKKKEKKKKKKKKKKILFFNFEKKARDLQLKQVPP